MTQALDDTANPRSTLKRYADLIAASLRAVKIPEDAPFPAEDADRLQLERGATFAAIRVDPSLAARPSAGVERLIAVASPLTLDRIEVVDRLGHHRPVYRPFLIYSWLQAFRAGYELLPRSEFGRWEEATRAWCDALESRLGEFNWPPDALPAGIGDQVAEMCWIGSALQVAGKVFVRDAWTDLSADVFGKLARRQREAGSFLTATGSDNPETFWFHELVILDAAAGYAVRTEDRALAKAVARATEFHLRETQPDHATNQPWGLFAFAWNPATRTLADALLHSGSLTATTHEEGLSLMLLADALYSLRLFE